MKCMKETINIRALVLNYAANHLSLLDVEEWMREDGYKGESITEGKRTLRQLRDELRARAARGEGLKQGGKQKKSTRQRGFT